MRRRLTAVAAATALAASAVLVSVASPASSGTFAGTNCKIAYVHEPAQSNTADIFLMNADGSVKTNLTNLASGSVNSGPTWTPDGTKMAYSRELAGGTTFEIVVMNADGSNPTVITTQSFMMNNLTYSPDGTKIAFAAFDGVYVASADGSVVTKIVNASSSGSVFDTQFAPDGRLTYRDLDASAWYFVNADGSGSAATTWSQPAEGLSFSPDGSKVLYSEYVTNSTDMYVSNVDGSGAVLISVDDNGYEDEGQSWSPDGTKTVWTQEDASTGKYQVMLSNPDGSGLVDLTQEPTANNKQPAWGPGGAGTPCASDVPTTTTTAVPTTTTTAAGSDPSTPKFTG